MSNPVSLARQLASYPPPTSEGAYLPTGQFAQRRRIRAYEPRGNGALDMGGIFRYCELAANAASAAVGFDPAWYASRGEGWVIFRQHAELVAPVGVGEAIDLYTWVRQYTRVSAQRDYLLLRASDRRTVARVSTTWAFVDREGQSPRRIPAEINDALPKVAWRSLPDRPAWGYPASPPVPIATFHTTARHYETDQLRHINNCVYADWLTEAAILACADWGRAADLHLVALTQRTLRQRRLLVNYGRSAHAGDAIIIVTTPERIGSRGLILNQVVRLRDGTELVTAQQVLLADEVPTMES